jgi:hypothetical protein
MDSTLKRLIELGAQTVGGNVILNRKVVAVMRHGQVILTPEGADALTVGEAVEVVEPAPAAVTRGRKSGKTATTTATTPVPAPEPVDLDNLLPETPDTE